MAKRVRREPAGGRAALQVEQMTQPVADRAPVHPAPALIAEQRRRSREPGAHVIGEPAQDQVQPVQHRHPPWPRPRRLGALAEPDMDLAERAPAEVQVPQLQRCRLLRPQARVIQRPVQRVVPSGRAELPRRGDPPPQELEELRQPLRRGRRRRRRRVIRHMPGSVELIQRALQPHAERGLDLARLASREELMETLEGLHVGAPGRRRDARRSPSAHHPVHVFPGDLPRGLAERRQHPLQPARRAVHRDLAEAPRHPRGGIRRRAVGLEPLRIGSNQR